MSNVLYGIEAVGEILAVLHGRHVGTNLAKCLREG